MGNPGATDTTPSLWRYPELEMLKPAGSLAEPGIARPLWWTQKNGAKVNAAIAAINLGMHETGISGEARVLRVGVTHTTRVIVLA